MPQAFKSGCFWACCAYSSVECLSWQTSSYFALLRYCQLFTLVIAVVLHSPTCSLQPACPPAVPLVWKIIKIWLIWNVGYPSWLSRHFSIQSSVKSAVSQKKVFKLNVWPKIQPIKHSHFLSLEFALLFIPFVVYILHLTSQKRVYMSW